MRNKKNLKVHFIGIGGIGMSSLALFLLKNNYQVSGSDIGNDPSIYKLKKNGCVFFNKHSNENITDQNLIIYSSAIKSNNPEILQAKNKNIEILKRGEALGFFTKKMKNITVSGCHGKSTTTSMTHLLVKNTGNDSTAFIGALDRKLNSNFYSGGSNLCIIEGDESDNSFNKINSYISVVTNIDNDHLDFYKTQKNLLEAFRTFILKTKKKAIVNNDCKLTRKLLKSIKTNKLIKFGQFHIKENDYSFEIIENKSGFDIRLYKREKDLGIFKSKLYGEYNAYNLVASIIVALELGINSSDLRANTKKCLAPRRRFETILKNKEVTIIDDYAHHPAAIKAIRKTIEKNFENQNIVLIFQPHRFSRTKILLKDFVEELSKWKKIYMVDIYSAFERTKIDADSLYKKIKLNKVDITYFSNKNSLVKKIISDISKKNYTIITMGAGDIRNVGLAIKKQTQ